MDKRTILVWFRNDLRIHDNEILLRAIERGQQIVPVYCFDPRHFELTEYGTRKMGVLRAAFLRENVLALQGALRNLGGDLISVVGYPEEMLPHIAEEYQVDEVYHHREVAFEETQVSALVEAALWKKTQINLRHFIGHTLYHKEDLPFPIRDIPNAFSLFKKKTERESTIRPQLGLPERVSTPENMETSDVPSLQQLGFSPGEIRQASNLALTGGEQEALDRMDSFLNGYTPQATDSGLSPYIAIGALSPNTLYHAVKDSRYIGTDKKYLEQFILKLLWRDYFRFMFKKHGNRFFQTGGITGLAPETAGQEEILNFDKWKAGNTGQPVIDRGIRQLNETGHIPHQMRVLLATYLIHELGVSWLKGAAWFEEKLIDYNPANNYGNWAHLAGVGSSVKDNKRIDLDKLITQLSPAETLAI
ncbi:DASH family cryptochrome [Parapedobacter lycopersici]|uniref:DASH family cryptochrome n=1 Tax=Parapedobacter lycopersici TaxID=1864939 RepID=UPI00214DA958|nr:DASH family cryptochrome [Parapedobacter lycopersici]